MEHNTEVLPDLRNLCIPNNNRVSSIYVTLILTLLLVLCSLPLISLDVSVRATGLVRPINERTEIRSMSGGNIEKIYKQDGDFVQKDSLILSIRNTTYATRRLSIMQELQQKILFTEDLEQLCSYDLATMNPRVLKTPLYQQELGRFRYKREDLGASLFKVSQEMKADSSLFSEKVISAREFGNKRMEMQKLQASVQAMQNEQIGMWQQQLATYRSDIARLKAELNQLEEENFQAGIRAPVSGIIQGMGNRYAGGYLQPGEVFCALSPETSLIAECLIDPKDIGLLKTGNKARFQVDAFDYKYFGSLQGEIIFIDNDYTIVENKPMFRVRCSLDSATISLKNGFTGKLKKGLTLRARFIVANRTILQLLFDNIDDWLGPGKA